MSNIYTNVPFDIYVSLGYNCEVSFRIRDFQNGKLDSYPFSWAYIMDRKLFVKSLDYLDDVLTGNIQITPWYMIIDEDHGLSFHIKPQYRNRLFSGEELDVFYAAKALFELKNRFSHLVSKFRELLVSDKRTLFVIKVLSDEVYEEWLEKLYEWLDFHYISGCWKLLIVLEENSDIPNGKFLETAGKVQIAKVSFFAPDSNTEFGGCGKEWQTILEKII